MTPASRVSRPSHDETKTAILRTARELFAEYGVAKTTLGDIAEALHRTKTFVYHYFESKTHILQSLIEMEGNAYIKELEASFSGVSGARQSLRPYLFARALKGFEIEWATTEEESFEDKIDAWISILFDGIGTHDSSPPGSEGRDGSGTGNS